MTTILHAVDVRPEPDERRQRAMASWPDAGSGVMRASVLFNRDSRNIGDDRNLPYWKDLISAYVGQPITTTAGTIVMWTNDDNVLHPQLPEAVRRHVAIWGVCLSHRREFKTSIPSLNDPPADWVAKSEFHMGYDLFAASVEWINQWWDELPDWIMGAEQGDLHLAAMVFRTKGFKWQPNDQKRVPCIELPPGLISHEWHRSSWLDHQGSPASYHNRQIFRDWARQWLPDLKLWK